SVAAPRARRSECGVVLRASRVSQGEVGATGQIQASRSVGGKEVVTLSPGVVLAGVDETVEKVLFSQLPPHEAQRALDPTEAAQRDDPKPKRRWGRKPR